MQNGFYLSNVKYLPDVKYLPEVQYLNNVQYLPEIQGLTETPFSGYTQPFRTFNDSYEKANSLLDVVFGSTQRYELLKEEGLEWAEHIPLLNMVVGTGALIKDKYFDPVYNAVTGEESWEQAGKDILFNTLTEVSEDLDIFSNVIKSQFTAAGGGNGVQDFRDALGLDGRRKVYNFNTGNTLEDIALEFISDPLNWFMIGSSIAKGAGKSAASEAIQETTEQYTKELSEQAMKDWTKAVRKTVLKEGDATTFEKIIKAVNPRSLEEIANAHLIDAAPEIIKSTLGSNGYRLFNAASKLKAGTNAIDTAITKTAWAVTPVGIPAKYLTPMFKEAFSHLYNAIINKLKNYDLLKNFVKHQDAYKEALKNTMLRNKAIYESTFRDNRAFLNMIRTDEVGLQKYMYSLLNQLDFEKSAIDLNEAFIKYLDKNNDVFHKIYQKKTQSLIDYLHSKQFDKLIEATLVGPEAIIQAEKSLQSSYHRATYNSMKKYIDANKNNLEEIYKYIDETVLQYNGKHFGLDDLDGFLREIITDRNTSKEYYNKIATLLESVGINRSNNNAIKDIINSQIKDKSKAIMKVLEQTHDISLRSAADYSKLFNKVNNQIQDSIGNAASKAFKEEIATHNIDYFKGSVKKTYKNMKEAVKSIKANTDLEHARTFLQDAIRLNEMPDSKRVVESMHRFLEHNGNFFETNNFKITEDYFNELYDFLHKTDYILDNIDTKLDVVFEIPKWYDAVNDLQKRLELIQEAFIAEGGPYAVEPRKFMTQIQDALKVFTSKKVIDPLVNYIDSFEGMIQAQLSHLGMFNVLVQKTFLSEDQYTKDLLEQLANKESVYRKQIIPNIITHFEQADMPQYAEGIKKVIAQVDTTRNLEELLNTELATPFKLSSKTQSDLKNIVWDTIENHKNYLISDIRVTDKLSLEALEPLKYSESILSGRVEDFKMSLRNRLYDSIDNSVRISKTVQDRIAKDTIGLAPDYVSKEIRKQTHKLLDDYINKQALLLDSVSNISLSTLFDLNTVQTLEITEQLKFMVARNAPIDMTFINDYNTVMRDFKHFSDSIQLGIDTIKDINNKLAVPLQVNDAVKYLKQVSETYNLYTSSIESGMYTAKYLAKQSSAYNIGPEDFFKISKDMFRGSNQEYLMLVENLNAYRDLLHEAYKYEADYIETLRSCLTITYSRNNALFAPIDAINYFNSLDAEQLLAWETFTKTGISSNNRDYFYQYLEFLRQQKHIDKYSKSDLVGQLNFATRNNGVVDDEVIGNLAALSLSVDATDYANRIIDSNLLRTLHCPEDLGSNRADLIKYFEKNVRDQDYITKTIHDIVNDPDINTSYLSFGNTKDMRDLGGAEYGYKRSLSKTDAMIYAERQSIKALSINDWDAEELATFLYRDNDGYLVFHNSNIIKTQHVDGSITWDPIEAPFKKLTEQSLKDAGVKMTKVTNDYGDWYYFRLIDNREHNKLGTFLQVPTTNMKVHNRYNDLLDNYKPFLNMLNPEDVPTNLLTVEILNEQTMDKFLDANVDFFGDLEERKLYQKFTPQGNSSFYDKSFDRLNLTIIGGYDTYNIFNQLYSDDFIPRSVKMSENTLSGLTGMVNRSNKINKYLSIFFNKDWSLQDSELLREMFNNVSDKRISDFFKSGTYKVAVLKEGKDGLPKVLEYKVHNRFTLDKASKAGGILVPRETFSAMQSVVNSRKMTNNLLDIYRRIIPSTYKSMYLYTAGFPVRNFFDTWIYKNVNEVGPEIAQYYIPAFKAMDLHEKLQDEMLTLTGGETLNKDVILEVLSKHTKEEADVYFLTDLFIQSPASGGLTSSLSDWLEEYNKMHTDDIRMLWEKVYEDDILFAHTKTHSYTPQIKAHPLNPLARLREANDAIEQGGRMALFLASIDGGMNVNDAIDRVVKTHFNYSGGGDMMTLCERIFWFSTFPINNFNYYIDGGLSKNPMLLRLLMDAQTASWNNGEYTYEELKKTNFLAYHAMSGNIRINNFIIKLSPSLFDFINLATNTPANIKDRLNPFLSLPMNTDNIGQELNPLQTQFRLFPKQLSKEDWNPVPSLISKINSYDWDRTFFKWHGYNKTNSGTWTHYPKIKKSTAYIRYVRKYYSRRYRTDVRKVSRTSLYHDAVNYYRIGGRRRGITYRDL